jgi:ribulose-5-phosphate 4-epimerase/fuculose-1-phosphate aldolase
MACDGAPIQRLSGQGRDPVSTAQRLALVFLSHPVECEASPVTSPSPLGNQADTIQARIDLAAAFRCAARLDLHEGVCNHFSMLLPGRRFLINPKGMHFERMTASSLIVIDEFGKTLEGNGIPSMSGHAIHTRIHLNHPAARVVLHLHAPYSTALTAIDGGRLEMVHQNSTRFLGQIAYDDDFNGIATDIHEGDRMAVAMGDKPILFLANHGVIVVAESVARAFDDFYYLERACQVQLLAMQSGRKLRVMSHEMARMTHEQFGGVTANAEYHFNAMKGILDVEEPAYAS